MKKYSFIPGLALMFVLTSCGVGEAEDFAGEFHKKLDQHEYDYIVENMIDPETIEETGEEQWYDMFEYIESTWGTAESRDDEFDFQSGTSNGITSVELNYTVQFSALKVYERIFLVDRGEGFKVSGLFMSESKAGLNEMAGN